HFELTALGVNKRQHEDFDLMQANEIFSTIIEKVAAQQIPDTVKVNYKEGI
ncbi:MAG: hypothetical protein JST09_20675, partial [Bacteroidetes bacterium]|nr:hypothetical protein [Bacteroidota bacterium]